MDAPCADVHRILYCLLPSWLRASLCPYHQIIIICAKRNQTNPRMDEWTNACPMLNKQTSITRSHSGQVYAAEQTHTRTHPLPHIAPTRRLLQP